jgi:hypothetical protein
MAEKNQSPYDVAMNFATFFANIYDEFTGSTSTIEERGKVKMPDGAEYPNLVQVSRKNPGVIPICGDTGAQYLIHHVRLILNQHNSVGELERDEIAEIAGNAVTEPIDIMMFNRKEYGVVNLEKLEAEGLSLFDSLYIFLTGLKNAGIRGWAGGMYQIKVETKQEGAKAQQALMG